MVAFVLAVAILSQQLQVSARVTPERVLLGDTLVLSITVHSSGEQPIEITNPPLTGFEIQGSREQSQVTLDGGRAARITRRDLTLRAVRVGTIAIPPVRVRQGDETTETPPLSVTVSSAGAGSEAVLGAPVRALVARSAAPSLARDEVGATVLVSSDTVVLGEQVDLVVVAWFPRAVRSRLRTPPTLRPPQLQGAWSYQRPSPAGIAMSRQVNGVWYDLFVHHQAMFPLTVGATAIGSATVSYTLPLTYSFLSRELRHEVETRPLAVHVNPQPEGSVEGFDGAAGDALRLELRVAATEIPLGGAIPMAVTLSGVGNVALWPVPKLQWPSGLRIYPGDVEVRVSADQGRLGGSKAFNFLAVADSVGAFRILPMRYVYFDTGLRRHRVLRADPVTIAVTGAVPGGRLQRMAPPPLVGSVTGPSLGRVANGLPTLAWVLVFLLPPLGAGLARTVPTLLRRLTARRVRRREPLGDPLTRLDREFGSLLGRLVADAQDRDGEELADALRAAGVEAPVAAHAARVRDRLRLAVYGPADVTDTSELAAEVQEVLRALWGTAPQGRRGGVVAAVMLGLLTVASQANAQTPERLYEAGAVRVAADSFSRRAEAEPAVPAHWMNLGSALYRLGDESGARAAWVRAARLSPRDAAIASVRSLISPRDRTSARLTWVSPVTPAEALLIALTFWVTSWVLIAIGRRPRTTMVLLGLAILAGGFGGYVATRYAEPVAIVRTETVPLRMAPYGSAPATRGLASGSAVLMEEERGAWVRVRRGEDVGWLLSGELVRL